MYATTLSLLLGSIGGLSLIIATLGDPEVPSRPGFRNASLTTVVGGTLTVLTPAQTVPIAFGIGFVLAVLLSGLLHQTRTSISPTQSARLYRT
jgi:hypothetical protein